MLPKRKNLLDLIRRNGTSSILIKHPERSLKFITAENFLLIHGGNYKLRVVYLIALIDVHSFEQGIYFFIA